MPEFPCKYPEIRTSTGDKGLRTCAKLPIFAPAWKSAKPNDILFVIKALFSHIINVHFFTDVFIQ
jgi:hypothetical protein